MVKVLSDVVGETLSDRYRVISRIAGGGMGEVYRGHDLLLDRAVAVKVLRPSLAEDPELVHRFKAEARAAARLSHPNVVQVHDWGSERDSLYYMVMEYVAGTDLRDVLVGRGPLPPQRAAEVTAAVCDALQAAHARGLVHRDVKPENVLIARDGKVKVADFGIAAVADVERAQPGGTILGTLKYLSPEQASGLEATKASDIWAAGTLLFELLIGSPPQSGSGAELLRRRAVEQPTAPSSVEPFLPVDLDRIVLRACAVEPSERYSSAGDMARDLRSLELEEEPDPAPVEAFLTEITGEIDLPDLEVTEFVGRAALKKQRRGTRGRKIRFALMAAVALLLVGGGVKAATAIFGAHEVDVPRVEGLTFDQATVAAEDAGLEIEVTAQKRSPKVAEGSVISQSPEDGLLLEGKAIGVVLSKGLPLSRVPVLTGLTYAEARKEIKSAHLLEGKLDYKHSQHEVGYVLQQSPSDKRVEWHTQVDLVVSKGPRSIAVPSVEGMKLAKAERALKAEGFNPVVVEEFSDDVHPGFVIATEPAGLAEAPEGSDVQVYVSTGPEFKELKLPDVRQMDVAAATDLLESKGLRVTVQQSGACEGGRTVVETTPEAGSTVRENDVIALFVC
jgi:serine/threonine-protein kinase